MIPEKESGSRNQESGLGQVEGIRLKESDTIAT
jgi:hypothetical protein